MTKPDSSVFISGIPDPAAMYMTLPDVTGWTLAPSRALSPRLDSGVGSARLVVSVADALMIPKISAKAM